MAENKEQEQLPETEEQAEVAESTPETAPNKLLKMGLFIGAPILLIAIVLAALFFTGIIGGTDKAEQAAQAKEEAEHKQLEDLENIFVYSIPSMLINLKTPGKKSRFLKVSFDIELGKVEQIETIIEQLNPRIVDQFQIFLRELTVEDLQGSAGMQRVREELVDRANAVVKPLVVHNVLFKEMLVQ